MNVARSNPKFLAINVMRWHSHIRPKRFKRKPKERSQMRQTQSRYRARCSFGAAAGMTTGSACGRLVGRGHLMCTDHEQAEVVRMGIAYPSAFSWALAAVMAVGTELAMVALTWAS